MGNATGQHEPLQGAPTKAPRITHGGADTEHDPPIKNPQPWTTRCCTNECISHSDLPLAEPEPESESESELLLLPLLLLLVAGPLLLPLLLAAGDAPLAAPTLATGTAPPASAPLAAPTLASAPAPRAPPPLLLAAPPAIIQSPLAMTTSKSCPGLACNPAGRPHPGHG